MLGVLLGVSGVPARARMGAIGLMAAMAALVAGCASATTPPLGPGRVIDVVAAENFWGSIAAQLGGTHARVTSIVDNPNADPHSYEPTTGDARAVAMAGMVIANGLGYDTWISKLIAADPGNRLVLTVGKVLRLASGSNPHRWYDPYDVKVVVSAIAASFSRLDPRDARYFESQKEQFESVSLRTYDNLASEIKARYGGSPVGASESIFSMVAPALGLNVITPVSFLKAVSEGSDVSATDVQTIDSQIKKHMIRIYVYNSQNTTPEVRAQLQACKAAGIPTVAISETLTPASASYQSWQSRQLAAILAALERAGWR